MSFFATIDFNANRERTYKSLPAGSYGTKDNPNKLKVVKYLGCKPTQKDPDKYIYKFLVGSENAEGTAFLSINLKALFLDPAAVAIASSGKKRDFAYELVEAGKLTVEQVQAAHAALEAEAKAALVAANWKDDQITDETIAEQKQKVVNQIRINVGQMFALFDNAGQPRPEGSTINWESLVGATFAGKVIEDGTGSKVQSVYEPRKQ